MHERRDREQSESASTRDTSATPGRRPLVHAQRKATSDGTLEGAHAATVLDRADRDSSGAALPDDVRGDAEARFGRDFEGVRVHTDTAAARAAQDLNAHAFTVGPDIYFDRGQYAPGSDGGDRLLAHELAHVVQGAGGAASAAGTGPTVSAPGDAAEVAADAAAERFVRREPIGDVGGPPRGAASCDAVGDLRTALEGGLFTGPDLADVWTKLDALSDGERRAVATCAGPHYDTVRRIVELLATAADLMRLLRLLPFALVWKDIWIERSGQRAALTKAHWDEIIGLLDEAEKLRLATAAMYRPTMAVLASAQPSVTELIAALALLGRVPMPDQLRVINTAGRLGELTPTQWESLVAFASPTDREALRGDATVFQAFLRNAPSHLLMPREQIEGLRTGAWAPTPAELTAAVAALSVAQKQNIRADAALMTLMVDAAKASAADLYRMLRDLDEPIKWCIWHLRDVIASVTADQWGEMCGGATADEMAEVEGWPEVKALYEANCPANIRTVRGEADTATADPAAFTRSLGRARVGQLFTTLGAAGLLDLVAEPAQDAHANYVKVQAAGFSDRVVAGLPVGQAMGQRTIDALRRWFFEGGETGRTRLGEMFGKRFAVAVNGPGGADHSDERLVKHTPEGLRQAWEVLESLPPQQVEGNDHWEHFLRVRSGDAAYHWRADDSILMPYRAGTRDLNRTDRDPIYGEGGQYAGVNIMGVEIMPASPAVPMRVFNSTLRHEIGHAVDAMLGITDRMMSEPRMGGWTEYPGAIAFVDGIIAQFPGGIAGAGYPAADTADYRQAMIDAVTGHITFQAAINAIASAAAPPRVAAAAPDRGPISVVYDPARWSNDDQPWDTASWQATPSLRFFHESSASNGRLLSFNSVRRAVFKLTDYQWRAPREWFAEAYQIYYAEQENDPNAPVGGILRSKDPDAAALMSNLVDRGYSPQEMRGSGGRPDGSAPVAPPGT